MGMTREQLIKAIDENEDAWSCPEYYCNMPEEEGNSGECCRMCAEKQLKAYEDSVRAEAIEEFAEWFDKEYAVYQKYYGGICKVKIATTIRRYELKEQNNERV